MPVGPRTPLAAIAALAFGAALVAGCGGGSDDSGDAEASFEDAQLEWAQCMRENGVDVPDPEPGQEGFMFRAGEGPDLNSDSFRAAQEECGSILEDAIPEGERPDPAEVEDRLHEMTECLRDAGYDVPEPQIVTPGEEGSGPPPDAGEFPEEMERLEDDPEFQAASESCSEEAGVDELRPPGADDDGS